MQQTTNFKKRWPTIAISQILESVVLAGSWKEGIWNFRPKGDGRSGP